MLVATGREPVLDGHDLEARTLYEILQDHALPLYYERAPAGYSAGWIRMAKRSIATLLPRFNSGRMLNEYVDEILPPGSAAGPPVHGATALAVAGAVADFKRRVRDAWPPVALRRVERRRQHISFGERISDRSRRQSRRASTRSEVVVELRARAARRRGRARGERRQYALAPLADINEAGEHRYRIELAPELCGHLEYRLRAYPSHPDFTHPYEMGLMRWA